MNRLNRKVEYALMALNYMSQRAPGQLISAKEICQATDIPFDATSRVMQQMAQRGILKVEHGAHGGYILIRDLKQINFLEIIQTITGPVEVVRCVNEQFECELFAKCNMVSPLKKFNEKLIGFYSSLSLSELTQSEPKIQPELGADWI